MGLLLALIFGLLAFYFLGLEGWKRGYMDKKLGGKTRDAPDIVMNTVSNSSLPEEELDMGYFSD
jgi:hypothetical protein